MAGKPASVQVADMSVLILGEAHKPQNRTQFWIKFELILSESLFLTADRRGSHIIKRRPLWSRFGVLGSTSPERNTLYDEYSICRHGRAQGKSFDRSDGCCWQN